MRPQNPQELGERDEHYRRAEEALRESERNFRAIANGIPQLAWMADSTGWIFWYNERWYEYTGTTLEQMQGWGWTRVHHSEHVNRVVERIQRAFDTGEPWEDTFPLRSRTGEYRWFLSRALPIKDAEGHVIRWFGTNTDVTEQLAAAAEREQLLEGERQVRERITTILESITDAFFALDREWRFTHVNREAERVLHRSRAELLGRSIWTEFREAVGTTFEREYRRAMTEQVKTEFEEFYPPLDRWFEVHVYPSPEGLSVYFHDVTERRLAADALRESEERFRALAENANAAIFVIDAHSTIQFANPAVEQIFGYAVEEVLGQPLDRLMPEDQRPLHGIGMQRYLTTGRRTLRWEGVELPGLRKDGRIVPLEISFGEFVREGRRYFTGIARDVTQRKQAEQERERLLAREQEARAEAERRRDELAHVTESRARLMRGFSHDVKNPLNAADGWAHMLERAMYGELPEKAQHNIGRIRRSIRHALEVIESLHELARTEAGDIPIKAETVNVRELASMLAEEYRVTAETAGLSFSVDTSRPVPPILTDANRVRQILGNLLSNAIKYTDQGGVTLRVSQAGDDSQAGCRECVKIDVIDSGQGIAADQQERLFMEFVRVNPGDKPGTGLGLAISQRLAQMLGGRITLHSEPGRGSTFTLLLPAATPQHA